MNPRLFASARTALLLLVTAVLLSSCTALHSSLTPMHGAAPATPGLAQHGSADGAGGGLVLHMHDASTVRFAADKWDLTVRGVRGTAQMHASDGRLVAADTTISYWDISSAAAGPGRGTLLSQFLLTILGVILVIGLAAIILYAAFLATNR